MNLCVNAFVIQFPDGLLDTCSVPAPRALVLPYAHRGHCKDEDSYKECSSHVEFSISLTRIVPNYSTFKGGIIRSNRLAFPRASWKNAEHVEQSASAVRAAQDQIARSGARCRSSQALQPAYGAGLYGLDSPIYFVPWQSAL